MKCFTSGSVTVFELTPMAQKASLSSSKMTRLGCMFSSASSDPMNA